MPNKQVGWKKCEWGNIQKETDTETEKSINSPHPTRTFSTLLVYLAPKSNMIHTYLVRTSTRRQGKMFNLLQEIVLGGISLNATQKHAGLLGRSD